MFKKMKDIMEDMKITARMAKIEMERQLKEYELEQEIMKHKAKQQQMELEVRAMEAANKFKLTESNLIDGEELAKKIFNGLDLDLGYMKPAKNGDLIIGIDPASGKLMTADDSVDIASSHTVSATTANYDNTISTGALSEENMEKMLEIATASFIDINGEPVPASTPVYHARTGYAIKVNEGMAYAVNHRELVGMNADGSFTRMPNQECKHGYVGTEDITSFTSYTCTKCGCTINNPNYMPTLDAQLPDFKHD